MKGCIPLFLLAGMFAIVLGSLYAIKPKYELRTFSTESADGHYISIAHTDPHSWGAKAVDFTSDTIVHFHGPWECKKKENWQCVPLF